MSLMVTVMLVGAIPLVLLMFALWPARRAAVAGLLFCMMFLPARRGWILEGLPDYDKVTAGSLAVLLGVLLFDSRRLMTFRPRWFDLPMLLILIGPIFSAVQNKIGGSTVSAIYGGATISLDWLIAWGVPYFIGRIYFTKLEHLQELAVILFYAGLLYAPFCLYEIRFSPQLNKIVYGYYQHSFVQTMRLGGYRPMVFMNHGLMVGMFMTSAALIGLYLWWCGSYRRLLGVPIAYLAGGLLVVTLLCKSTGALGLLFLGMGLFAALRYARLKLALAALILVAPTYMATRIGGVWTGRTLVEWVEPLVGDERAKSLEGRMRNEDLFVSKAQERLWWGWSGWNRFQVRDDYGRILTTPDGLWVIALGTGGLVALISLTVLLLYPATLMWWRFPTRLLISPALGPVTAVAVVLVLWMIDNVLNAMPQPALVVAAAALPTAMPRVAQRQPAAKSATTAATPPPRRPVASRATQPRVT